MSELTWQLLQQGPDYGQLFGELRDRVERRLHALTPVTAVGGQRLQEAIGYSLLDGGKRLRPLATLLTATALGAPPDRALDPACAIEMVHTASLMLDDLPCMDDAERRRGKPANHRKHGEDIAILGAVSLISEAFGVLSRSADLDAGLKVVLTGLLSDAIGIHGLCAGQERDLRDVGENADLTALEQMQQQKTGALFVVCVETGARIAGVAGAELEPYRGFGRRVGLAFQIFDDLLDASGATELTGKDGQQDRGKPTFASVMRLEEAERRALNQLDAATDGLAALGERRQPLVAFNELIVRAYREQRGRLNGARRG